MELNIDNKKIEKLFAEFFGLDSSYIHQCYREFKDAYNQQLSLPHEGFIPKQKQSWKIFQEQQTLNHWEKSTLIGVDLPLFFKCPDPKAQTVMLVALDPLRNPKHFSDFKDEDVIIGTPFAQHSSHYREHSQEIVFNFIKHIVDKNYHMYVTDVYKVWMKDDKKKNENKGHDLNNESTIFEKLLRKELDIIDPKIVITFGNVASDRYTYISKDCEPRPHKHFTHPSRQARGAWKKLIGKYSKPMVLEYLKTEIDKELD